MRTIQQRPVAVDSEIDIPPVIYIVLSHDYRLVDSCEAIQVLGAIETLLEG